MNRPWSRTFSTLRVSLTQACNQTCSYCVDPKASRAVSAELPPEQLALLVEWLHSSLGLHKIKLTGGEPLLGNRINRFLAALPPLAGVELGLTTNGQRLEEKLPLLESYGVRRINVSLDSLDPVRFNQIGGGRLELTLQGIEAALARGFSLKLNQVPMKGINDLDCMPLLEFALHRKMELRFIELMPMGHLQGEGFARLFYGLEELVANLGSRYKVTELMRPFGSTALLFAVSKRTKDLALEDRPVGSPQGRFGVIANHSRPFCGDCDRLRLSANGELVGCLSSGAKFDLKPLLSLPAPEAQSALRQILAQALATKQPLAFVGSDLGMKTIGG